MESEKAIIYIMSDVRSGSTLLENILSNSNNIVSIGELHHLDSHLNKGQWGKTWEWKCTCGADIVNCVFWSKVLENRNAKGLDKIQQTEVIKNNSPKLSKRLSFTDIPENKEVIHTIDTIYDAIFEVTGKQFIVDASKNEIQLATLIKHSKHKIKVIYLKRDIRAVVLSKQKWQRKLRLEKKNIFKQLITTKVKYYRQNRIFNEFLKDGEGIKLNYFDLTNDVAATLQKIIRFIKINQFPAPQYMERHNNHSIGGTPNRERKKISYDNSWRKMVAKRPIFRVVGKIIDNL